MAKSAQIAKMSPRHEAIMNYIIANPTKTYGEVAGEFGVTQPWLSTIIHSQAFQEQLARRQEQVFDSHILQDIGDKLSAAAHTTLDAYLEKVPVLSADQLISSTDKLLGKLGFGTRAPGGGTVINGNVNVQQNHAHVSPEVLAEARNRIGNNQVGEADSPAALPDKSTDQGTQVEGTLVRTEGA